MPATTTGTRGNVGKARNELAKRNLPTKSKGHLGSNELLPSMSREDQLHYRTYKKNIITLESLKAYLNENNH